MNDPRVEKELLKLRNTSSQQLERYGEELATKRVAWYRSREAASSDQGDDILEQAYRLLLRKLNLREQEAPILRKTKTEIVFASKNYCPTLEACKVLGLDTRTVCRLYNEKATDVLVKQIDQRLIFSRSYERIRPYYEYCEESIRLRGEDERA